MARTANEEIAWKPRRLHREDLKARLAHLQKNLPPGVREVFAGDESRVEPVTPEPPKKIKKSKFAVLHWEPRNDGRNG
ncbi:MAG: hypothetical protein EBS05_24780 [Proteobacteria bacterium]|nr:hypothetical protein [Pseudomonadota bacterium]